MKELLARYQKPLMIVFQLVSLFLFAGFIFNPLAEELVILLFSTFAVGMILARWIQKTLTPLIAYYRLRGDFSVLYRMGFVSALLLFDVVFVAVGFLVLLNGLSEAGYELVTLGLAFTLMVLPSMSKIIQVYLTSYASPELEKLALLRRFLGIIGLVLIHGLLWLDADVNYVFAVGVLIQLALLIQQIRIRRTYQKEYTYRRQYEDSGRKESYWHLFKTLALQSISLVPALLIQGSIVAVIVSLPRLLAWVSEPLPDNLFTILMSITLAALVIRWLSYLIIPLAIQIEEAEQTNNQSRLTTLITAWLEQGALLETWVLLVVASSIGIVLQRVLIEDLGVILLSLGIGYLFGIHEYVSHVMNRTSVVTGFIMAATALVVVTIGSLFYSVYFGTLGVLITFLIVASYLNLIGYIWLVKQYSIELRVHLLQLSKVLGLLVLNAILLTVITLVVPPLITSFNLWLYFGVMGLVSLLILVVVSYAYLRITGLVNTWPTLKQLRLHFDTMYQSRQEEEAIW